MFRKRLLLPNVLQFTAFSYETPMELLSRTRDSGLGKCVPYSNLGMGSDGDHREESSVRPGTQKEKSHILSAPQLC